MYTDSHALQWLLNDYVLLPISLSLPPFLSTFLPFLSPSFLPSFLSSFFPPPFSPSLSLLPSFLPSFPPGPPLPSSLPPSLPPSLSLIEGGDMRLWLECRVMLARSLVGRSDGSEGGRLVECGGQCEEGVEECEACGEVELTAELNYTAALHTLTCKPRDLAKVSSHTQVGIGHLVLRPSASEYITCYTYPLFLLGSEGPSTKVKESDRSMLHCSLQNTLQLLESLPELSTHARLLRCQASILLADVSCVQGGATWGDMVQVFQGLVTMVKTQVQLSSTLCTSSTSSAWEREGREE